MTGQTQVAIGELTRSDVEERLIRKVVQDATFRETLLKDPQTVWQQEFGNTVLNDLRLQVFEETANTLYLVVPSQNEALEQELAENPKAVWKREFGTTRLEGYIIRVAREPSGYFYLVLPRQEQLPTWMGALSHDSEPISSDPESGSVLKTYRSLPRTTPRTKLGRIVRRLRDWLLMLGKTNPLIICWMAPVVLVAIVDLRLETAIR